mmetsp:Transcript_3606/g.6729  ORF Transcript_3606/g.6729 Transcript_3606/m.6729 type:complete len:114 (-) Transcript_3606:194-535(-)|eukprot:CAMPEP_0197522412 /NCGR_PEP_ID=MMETSP1318-20131121/7572_1 /TAXON_ID=552666 /ORGANISM="Partenskyella glossopodia, Strain RCC365" /LENGTH=113 /DNA_ID=CAMNT_0043074793 /DNA_START=145 /DNA_END=486 /DNA_ORIENTATION=+
MSLALDAEENKGESGDFVKLISSEGHEFICAKEVAMASGTIRRMLTGPGIWKENTGPIPTIHFETISYNILEKVIQYFYYKKQFDNKKGPLEKFDIEIDQLIPLLIAANFLDT